MITRRHNPTTHRDPRSRGLTLIEIVIVSTIILVAVNIFSTTVVATGRQRAINDEKARAMEYARSVLETMRNEPHADLFALYNTDESDDPMGPNTAPGARFMTPGLDLIEGEKTQGEVILPITYVAGAGASLQLREDYDDFRLGMPRDLNGDDVIDALDHSADYVILPVMIRVRWTGAGGEREIRVYNSLAEYEW